MKIRGMTILRIINDTESIWGYGSGRQTIKEMKKRDLQQIIDATKKHGELLVVEETSRATRSEGQKPEHWLERLETAQIALVTPLVSKGKLIGILFIDGKRSNDAFSSQDIELLDILAHQAAVAFDNAMLYSELEDRIRRRTAQLEDANKHLVKLDKAKTEFLSIASHQLRTPLSAIRGYISLLEDGDYGGLNEQQHGVLKKTDDNIRRLVSLVNDLLSLARIEAGTGPKGLNLTTEDFCSLVDVTVDELAIKAKNKGLEILWTRPEGRVEVELDKERMGQVVMNLIDNALNYTLKGRVTVGVDEQKDKVIFRVQDTGIGMDPETLGNLFTKFFRSQDAIKVKPDGSGIGLYVCKILVEAHEGTIAVTSTKDMGTAFTVELLKKCSARKTADPLDPVLQATQPES
ncbi:hypothetical protein AUK40_06275 [Candidatus Wirthbacteria bacterium CG2_30_54_11]|uniref:histidine kinase n=1 Tax=Candidatus Wirthbacteria bacterium CG2_30_54_11 TaxID=1817892 RepID=A0A1J5IDE6_9BACT|nr:MAG: hypothetical protein AUK40_06275 [Candidatus Wirthbacteria bacterium CG2_30_54_11]